MLLSLMFSCVDGNAMIAWRVMARTLGRNACGFAVLLTFIPLEPVAALMAAALLEVVMLADVEFLGRVDKAARLGQLGSLA